VATAVSTLQACPQLWQVTLAAGVSSGGPEKRWSAQCGHWPMAPKMK
jgi:hypothetical protein